MPRTVNNDIFFGNWGDPSTIGLNWNTRVEAPAFILEDDNIIIQGVLKMDSSDPEINRQQLALLAEYAERDGGDADADEPPGE